MADREVKIREGKLRELIALYRDTYKKLITEIVDASEAGKIRKVRVMARINRELEALGVDVNEWIKSEVPKYYLDGANVAIQDLRAAGADTLSRANFAVINQEAIKALTDDVALNMANAIVGVSRAANTMLTETLKKQLVYIIAQGKLTGDGRKEIAAALRLQLEQEGFTALRDKRGAKWTLERYTDMLVRTKIVEARNQGLTNRMLSYGYDLVQVSNHNSSHKQCHDLEGKILSLTGKTARGTRLPGGYVVWGSLQDAIEYGLFHPNCQHAINVMNTSLATKTKAYDNPYNHLSADEKALADKKFRNRNDAVLTP